MSRFNRPTSDFTVVKLLLYVCKSTFFVLSIIVTVIILLLDLSTAFGTVDHDIFLRRLNSKFSIYYWLYTIYPSQRQKKKKIAFSCCQMRVLQGSVQSPAHPVFTLYCITGRRCTTPQDAISLLRWQYSVIQSFATNNELQLTNSILLLKLKNARLILVTGFLKTD